MIIDSHSHVGKSIYGISQTPEQLLKSMKKYGIDRAVVIPFTPPDLDFKKANDYVAQTVKKYPDRFIGFGRIDPRQVKSALRELRRISKELKLSGLKLHPLEQGFQVNSALVRPVFREAAKLELPVFMSCGQPILATAVQVEDLAESLPDLKIIMAHGAQVDSSGLGQFDVLEMLKTCRNVYIESSGIPELGKDSFFERIKSIAGADIIVFGSDSPLMDQGVEKMRIEVTDLPPAEKKGIFGRNLARILGL